MVERKKNQGAIITLVLVFGGVFLVLLGAITGLILFQYRQSLERVAWNQALQIAEAGINYAQWLLLHNPENYEVSLVKDYIVGEEVIGQYQLKITKPDPEDCFSNIEITSTGIPSKFPHLKRTIKGIYGKVPLSKYAFLTNEDVWFGSTEKVKGLVYSNGGIRMDGSQNSLFFSSQESYTCKPTHGCSPPQVKPGIWGKGQGKEEGLWNYPSPAEVDFTTILENLDNLKQKAQPDYYFSDPEAKGYWIEFLGESFKVYKVTELEEPVWGWNMERWVRESDTIKSYQEIRTFSLPSDCKPIFVENNLWVSGTVKGKAIVIAAKLPYTPENAAKIIIKGNIEYGDGDSVLGLIAQKDILIPLRIENDLKIRAALLAKEGRVMRYFYPLWDDFPYSEYSIRNSIEIYGSIISKKEWTFTWVDRQENIISGYRETKISVDPKLIYQPPPHFPTIGEATLIDWEEVK